MSLQDVLSNSNRFAKRNAPMLLSGAGVVGVVATAVLTARATYKAAKIVEEIDEQIVQGDIENEPRAKAKAVVKATWLLYLPPTITGAMTIGCIVGSTKTSANRTAAAVAAYTITERALSEHKEKVREMLSAKKEEQIQAAIVKDHMDRRSTPAELIELAAADRERVREGQDSSEIVVLGPKRVRYFEDYSGRYFLCDQETLDAAVNKVNSRLIHENYVSLSYFYEMLGLGRTQFSDEWGWHVDPLLEIKIFPHIAKEDGEPCVGFSYNYVRPL